MLSAVSLRPATRSDRAWLFFVKRAAMREHVAAVFGWDETEQLRRFEASFDPDALQVICHHGRDVGLLEVHERSDHVFIARIELLPDAQRQGIGTHVITQIIAKARARAMPVQLQVFHSHPARRLYARLGFQTLEETSTHVRMELRP